MKNFRITSELIETKVRYFVEEYRPVEIRGFLKKTITENKWSRHGDYEYIYIDPETGGYDEFYAFKFKSKKKAKKYLKNYIEHGM